MPISKQRLRFGGLVGPRVWLCLSSFDVSLITFCRFEFQEIHFGSHLETVGHHLGATREPFGCHWKSFGSILRNLDHVGATWIFIEFWIILGSIWASLLKRILHTGNHLWWRLVVQSGIVFIVMLLI